MQCLDWQHQVFKKLLSDTFKDGNNSRAENDIARRNTIAQFMSDWGLLTVENKEKMKPLAPLRQIKIISFKEKNDWELCPKYNIGNK